MGLLQSYKTCELINTLYVCCAIKHIYIYPREGPGGGGGVKSRMCPPYPQRDRKRRLNGAVSRYNRIKRVAACRCLDGHVKEPYEMSMALGARP